MTVEFFTGGYSKGLATGTPMVTIIASWGKIIFNKAAQQQFSVQVGEYFIFGFDRKKQVVVMKRTGKNEPGARRMTGRSGGTHVGISCKPFLVWIGAMPTLDAPDSKRRFVIKRNNKKGWLEFSLSDVL